MFTSSSSGGAVEHVNPIVLHSHPCRPCFVALAGGLVAVLRAAEGAGGHCGAGGEEPGGWLEWIRNGFSSPSV